MRTTRLLWKRDVSSPWARGAHAEAQCGALDASASNPRVAALPLSGLLPHSAALFEGVSQGSRLEALSLCTIVKDECLAALSTTCARAMPPVRLSSVPCAVMGYKSSHKRTCKTNTLHVIEPMARDAAGVVGNKAGRELACDE